MTTNTDLAKAHGASTRTVSDTGRTVIEFYTDELDAYTRAAIQQAAVPGGLADLLQSCRGSVKTDLMRYEQLISSRDDREAVGVFEGEANRLRLLLDSIDALATSPAPPKQQPTGAAWAVQMMQDYKPRRLRLTIGVQSFDIDVDDEVPWHMEWFCDMLTKAMKNATSAPKQQPALGGGEGAGCR